MSYSLYLIRHGEAGLNRDNVVMGTINSLLTPNGTKQAESLHKKLSKIHFDKIYASPLKRAVDTASIVSKSEAIETDSRLLERTFGKLEGQPLEKLSHARELAQSRGADPWRNRLSIDTESDLDIFTRLKDFLDENSKHWDNKTILVVTHSGPVRALLIGLDFFTEESLPPGAFKNGSCAVINNIDGKFSLTKIVHA